MMSYTLHRITGLVVGAAIGLLAGYSLFYIWMLAGVMTGVLGMCASASETWSLVYFGLAFLIPGVAFFAGRGACRWFAQ